MPKKFRTPDEIPLFCRRVREARLLRGLSLGQFGKLIGIAQSNVPALESGLFPRDYNRVVAIADALDVSFDYLFGLTDNPERRE